MKGREGGRRGEGREGRRGRGEGEIKYVQRCASLCTTHYRS